MRILHLAYEDPAQPGSGGGSVRTLEINRRLSARHDITAVVAGYPGARARVEGGVRWLPIGTRRGGVLDRLSYFALLGHTLRHTVADLVVEDFGAPFSTGFAPRFTQAPVVASVQWLFAEQMRAKYHLPFDLVERTGLPLYHDFIVVSRWLAHTVACRRPGAVIEVIPNGVEPLAFAAEPAVPAHLLFVGRLDREQKGCDLLLEAYARAQAHHSATLPPLVIVGDGPDRQSLASLATRLGLEQQVRFRGRVEGAEKYRLMAEAFALLMPSRFETFGMVAVEAQAAGAPVIAFDIGPLAEVAGGGGACLVPPFDIETFASEIIRVVTTPAARTSMQAQGKRWAAQYDWERIALLQEAHYLRVLEQAGRA